MIHPTAIIEPGARIGGNAQIGAFCYVAATVILGNNCVLKPHATVLDHTTIGDRCAIHSGAVIGDAPQDLSFTGEPSFAVIGNDCTFREGATVHRGAAPGSTTRLGDHVYMMANTHVAHNCDIGDHVIMANGTLLGGHVTLGERVFCGGGSGIHQHCHIGRLAMIGATGLIAKDVPPFCITASAQASRVYGLNLIGLRRAGFTAADRVHIKAAFHLLYRSNLNLTQAKTALREQPGNPFAAEYATFLDHAKRGICRLHAQTDSPDDQ